MKKKIIATLLTALTIVGAFPIGVSAEWRQNSDSSWSWRDGYFDFYDGWKEIQGKTYYFKLGKMQTGWMKYVNSYWYYLGDDGARKTGWINDGGKSYYLKDDGVLATDVVINGVYFDSNGTVFTNDKQKVLVDNKYVKITYLGFDKYNFLYKKAEIQVENKSDKQLYITSQDASVDGFSEISFINLNINPGKTLISSIGFNSGDIKTNFDSIEGTIKIKDYKDFKELSSENFSIKFNEAVTLEQAEKLALDKVKNTKYKNNDTKLVIVDVPYEKIIEDRNGYVISIAESQVGHTVTTTRVFVDKNTGEVLDAADFVLGLSDSRLKELI